LSKNGVIYTTRDVAQMLGFSAKLASGLEFSTETGGEILIVQYPGPTTAGRPIYAGRFNMEKRNAVSEERTDI
jgi:hypothetical protein